MPSRRGASRALKGRLQPVDVVMQVGDSNTNAGNNSITDLPAGYFATDPNTFLWDAAGSLGSGTAIRTLAAPNYTTVTITIASPGVVTWTAHGLTAGTPIRFTTTGALPTGFATGTTYFIVNPATDTFQLATTRGGSAINTSGSQSGTHTAVCNPGVDRQPLGIAGISVGSAFEFIKHYRLDNPAKPLYFFHNGIDNGRFTDAVSRATNYDPQYTDGAYNSMKVQWAAFTAALAARGFTPNIIGCRFSMGGNATFVLAETNSFQADMEKLIGAMIADRIMPSGTKLMFQRISPKQSGHNLTNSPAVRTATENLALADTAHRIVMNSDGYVPWTGDNIHWNAPSCVIMGEELYYQCAGLWFPQKELAYNGGNEVIHEYRPGDFRNTAGATAFTTTGGNVQTAYDCSVGTISPTQATDANRPVISVTPTPNGYGARFATANGSSQLLTATTTFINNGAFAAFAAVAAPATTLRSVFSEASDTDFQPLLQVMRTDNTTPSSLGFLSRSDAGANLSSPVLLTGVWDNSMKFIAIQDTGSAETATVGGATGSAQSYTRGTHTVNRFSIYGTRSNGADSGRMNAKLGILWFTTSQPNAAYLANAWAYCQRRWGTA